MVGFVLMRSGPGCGGAHFSAPWTWKEKKEMRHAPQVSGSRQVPECSSPDVWGQCAVKSPPWCGALAPQTGSVLNCSNQNMTGPEGVFLSMKTNQRSRQDRELLRTWSSLPISSRDEQLIKTNKPTVFSIIHSKPHNSTGRGHPVQPTCSSASHLLPGQSHLHCLNCTISFLDPLMDFAILHIF